MDIKQWLRKGEKDEVFLIKDIATHGCSGAVAGIIIGKRPSSTLIMKRKSGTCYINTHRMKVSP